MPRQNRVTPFGTIEAVDARGTLMGNRGILHDDAGRLGTARWRHQNWVTCRLQFRGIRRTIMAPGSYTELFFLDEATAFAAGHRPCAECRRGDYRRFVAAWISAHGEWTKAAAVDRILHSARVDARTRQQKTWRAVLGELPSGTFVTSPDQLGEAWLKHGNALHRWTHYGYTTVRAAASKAEVLVLTPRPIVAVFAMGYAAELHPSVVSS
jgi:hypothetical protein